jgi:hypothetical protein
MEIAVGSSQNQLVVAISAKKFYLKKMNFASGQDWGMTPISTPVQISAPDLTAIYPKMREIMLTI